MVKTIQRAAKTETYSESEEYDDMVYQEIEIPKEPDDEPKKINKPKRGKVNAKLKTEVADDLYSEELMRQSKPIKPKKKATPKQIEALNKARMKRDELYKEREKKKNEIIQIKYEQERAKLEKQITRKIKSKLLKEAKELEYSKLVKQNKSPEYSYDDDEPTPPPVHRRVKEIRQPTRPINDRDYIRSLGF